MKPVPDPRLPPEPLHRAEHETCKHTAERCGESASEGADSLRQHLLAERRQRPGPSRAIHLVRSARAATSRHEPACRPSRNDVAEES